MNREYCKWYSKALGRDMELLIFGDGGEAIIFFPTRTARFYDYENWKIIEALQDKIESRQIQVYCVDSIDAESFYARIHPSVKISRHLQYENYILGEVIPLIRSKNSQAIISTAGCSLGGYHAVNIAFKYPAYFARTIGMSARYDLTLSANAFPDLLEGYYDISVYMNMPSMYIPNLHDATMLEQLRRLKVTIVIGKEDPFFENNQRLDNALDEKKINHQFMVWNEEAHRPRYWRQMVRYYF